MFEQLFPWRPRGLFGRPHHNRQQTKQRQRGCRLSLEELEDRAVPTVYSVNTLADTVTDATHLSLREALQAANTNAPVVVNGTTVAQAGSVDGDVINFDPSLGAGTITLTLGQLTITDDVFINGSTGATTQITLDGGNNSRIFNIAVTAGGGTLNTVRLANLTLNAGNPGAAADGGAILIGDGQDVSLTNVIVQNSTARRGGGIFNGNGNLTLSNSTVTANTANGGTAGLGGGGLFNSGGTLTLNNATVTANEITGTADGGGILNVGGRLVVAGGSVSNNNPTGADGREGGGIETNGGTVVLSNVTLNGNKVNGLGAGLDALGAASVAISGGTVNSNAAGGSGGGIFVAAQATLNVTGTTFDSDTSARAAATQGGGGLFVDGSATVTGATFSNDKATGAGGTGGGILVSDMGALTVDSSTFSTNTAAGNGGGLADLSSSLLSLTNVTFASNSAIEGGGLAVSGTGAVNFSDGTIRANTASDSGGGLWATAAGALSLSEVNVGGTTAADANKAVTGGGLFLAQTTATILQSSVAGNLATGAGGGGLFVASGTVAITNSTIANNQASANTGVGGGVQVVSGTVSLVSDTLANNTAGSTGGDLNVAGGTVTAGDSIFADTTGTSGADISGALVSNDYNLIQTTTGAIITGATTHNITGKDPLLGPLQNNGGASLTMGLQPNSPALGAGDPNGVTSDQRGVPRPQGNGSDIGAVENLAALQVLTGLSQGNQLEFFSSTNPGVVIATRTVAGLKTGENLVGIDVRPTNGLLYAVSNLNNVYSINVTTGQATLVSTLSVGFNDALAITLVDMNGLYADPRGFFDSNGGTVRWLHGLFNQFGNPWYWIKSDGTFGAWDGSSFANGPTGKVLANFGSNVFLNPDVLLGASTVTLSQAQATEAQTLDESLGLYVDAGGFFENFGMAQARWLRGLPNKFGNPWYFIRPSGEFVAWDGSATATGTVLYSFDLAAYRNPQLLYNASKVTLAADQAAEAQFLDQTLGLYQSPRGFFEDFGGGGAKWIRGDVNQFGNRWYWIKTDGTFGAWDGTTGPSGAVLFQFDKALFTNPQLLFNASTAALNPVDQQQARNLDETLGLHEAPLGFSEEFGPTPAKWLLGQANQFGNPWYWIKTDGSFGAWDGGAGATGTVLYHFDPLLFHNPELLFNAFTEPLTGLALAGNQAFGVDFDPTTGLLHIVANNQTNMQANVDTGRATLEGRLAYANTTTPNVVTAAFNNNLSTAVTTTFYGIDAGRGELVKIDPVTGILTDVGALGVTTTNLAGLDVLGLDQAFAVLTVGGKSQLYTINLSTGAATLAGSIDSLTNIIDVAVLSPALIRQLNS